MNSPTRTTLPDPLPLVGRTAELGRLESLMEDADAGPRVLFIRGEGGVGKSRLVAELGERAERRSWTVIRGRGYPVGTGVPYAVFADAWVPALTEMDASTLTVLSRGGEPELRQLFPALAAPGEAPETSVSTEPDEFRTRLMWNFAEFVKRYAARGPILCLLDDLQWADESSLELLHFLARQLAGSQVMVVCTYNDQDRDRRRALVRTERSLRDVGAGDVLHLQPLQRDQVSELVSRSFGVDIDVVRDFAGVLYGWTRGNAFFVEETLKAMAASGRLRRESGTWVGWDAKEFGMPATIRDAILQRAGDFPEETRKVLDMAAVVGSRVSFGVLESVTGLDAEVVLTAVEELCRVGLLEERSAGPEVVYDFRHPLVRQTLYDEFGLQRVRMLHGVVAQALETYYGREADRHADELAYHFARTDGHRLREKAIRYLAAAGAQALEQRADHEAIAYLRAAIERSDSDDAEGLQDVVPLLARALTHVGEFDEAGALWSEVLDRLPAEHPRRPAVLRALGMTHVWRGRHRDAARVFDEGLDAARASGDAAGVVRLLVAKAHGLHEIGQGNEALEVLAEALPIADEIGEAALLARVHRALALLHVWLGPPEKAIEHGERAIELADAVGDVSIRFWARWGLAVLAGMRGDPARMMRIVSEIDAMADEARSPVLRLWTTDMVVEHAFATGEWDTGLAHGEHAISLARSLNQRTLLPRLLVWTSQFHVARGDLERAEELVREAVDIAGIEEDGSVIDVHQVVPTYIGLAHYLVHLGEYEEAIEAAEKGLEIAEGTGYTLWAMHQLLPVLGEACLWAGRFDRAGEVATRMREHSERIDHRIGRALADACAALVQWKKGDPAGAVAQMEDAADQLEAIPVIWPATRLRRQLAGRLADIGRKEDALAQLRRVHSVCVSVRAGLELAKTRAMFNEIGARAPAGVPTPDAPLGLTEAELRVGRLVAEGMSNKAIAGALSCSPGTVRTHLQNIYQKLGIGGPGARHRLANMLREEVCSTRSEATVDAGVGPAIFPDMTAPEPPAGHPVSETRIGVRTSELDSFGHVNHAVYLNYFEHARFEALERAGFPWDVLGERGWAIFVVRIEVDYLAEAGRRDQLLVRTWADSFRRTSMVLAQEMLRDDDSREPVARARVTAVWIGPDRRPMRVPEEVRHGLTTEAA